MATAVIMPRQGQSVESCIITKWHKKEGDAVKVGDLLFTYETDKATFDEESKVDGILLKILHIEEDDVPCLETVCFIGAVGEDIPKLFDDKNNNDKNQASVEPDLKVEPSLVNKEEALIKDEMDFIKISPRAKNLAEKLNIDYSAAIPNGAEGRIIERDINELTKNGVKALSKDEASNSIAETSIISQSASQKEPVKYVDEKISNTRKVIAKAMLNSLQTTAQLTHTASFNATEILEFRKKIKPLIDKGELNNITLNDILMFTISRVLKRHKLLNAHMLNGDTIRYFTNVNLAMAVDTPRGLLVPVCFNADTKSLNTLSAELKFLASEAQKGTINPDLLSGGSFTVSNLGVFGTESFTPILNAPQTGIIGVNTIVTKIKEENGQIKTYPSMALSLTYDHRALDGVAAAKFLQDVCRSCENFTVTLAVN